jgi:hypothetical protein
LGLEPVAEPTLNRLVSVRHRRVQLLTTNRMRYAATFVDEGAELGRGH